MVYQIISETTNITEKNEIFKNLKLNLDINNNPIHAIINKMISDNINDSPSINELIKLWSNKKIKNSNK